MILYYIPKLHVIGGLAVLYKKAISAFIWRLLYWTLHCRNFEVEEIAGLPRVLVQ